MTYGSRTTVKEMRNLNDTTDDTKIDNILAQVSRYIDSQFRWFTTVPLTDYDTEIDDITNILADAEYESRYGNADRAETRKKEGNDWLINYIRNKYGADVKTRKSGKIAGGGGQKFGRQVEG